jgi:hypothetical protein
MSLREIGTFNGQSQNELMGSSVAINYNGTIIALGIRGKTFNGNTTKDGQVIVYRYQADNSWNIIGTFNGTESSELGSSVELDNSGNLLMISAPRYNIGTQTNVGRVIVCRYQADNSWNIIGTFTGTISNEYFGKGIALNYNGNDIKVAIGSSPTAYGRVDVYRYIIDNSWDSIGRFDGLSTKNDNIGQYITFSKNGINLAIGSPKNWSKGGNNSIAAGQVIIRKCNADNSFNTITIFDGVNGLALGDSLSFNYDGTIIAMGASLSNIPNTSAGNIIVQKYNASNNSWNKDSSMNNTNASAAHHRFGYQVKLDDTGKILFVTTKNFNPNNNTSDFTWGRVTRYNGNISSSWPVTNTLIGSSGLYFGESLGTNSDGTILITGSTGYNSNAGQVKVFKYVKRIQNVKLSGSISHL